MRIYNYLFYKTYIFAKASRIFDDLPLWGGIISVSTCLIFNILTIALFFAAIGLLNDFMFSSLLKYPFEFSLIILVLIYYRYKDHYKQIIEKYDEKYNGKNQLHPLVVIICYLLVSFGLLLLAELFKNTDWNFARLF